MNNNDFEIKAGFLISGLQLAGASIEQIRTMTPDEMRAIINSSALEPFSAETWDAVFQPEVLEEALPKVLAVLNESPMKSPMLILDEYQTLLQQAKFNQ